MERVKGIGSKPEFPERVGLRATLIPISILTSFLTATWSWTRAAEHTKLCALTKDTRRHGREQTEYQDDLGTEVGEAGLRTGGTLP